MEYFVRTSHIVAGMTYGLILLSWIVGIVGWFTSPDFNRTDELVVVYMAPIVLLFFLIVFSCLHYVVLKSFHPWAKMPEKKIPTQKS